MGLSPAPCGPPSKDGENANASEGKGTERKGRERKGREGKGREGKGQEGKGGEGKGTHAGILAQRILTGQVRSREDEEERRGGGLRVKAALWRLHHSPTQVPSSGPGAVERKAVALAFGDQASFPSSNPASFPGSTSVLPL